MGYLEIRLRADTEVATKALLEKVKDLRDHRGSRDFEVVGDAEALLNRHDGENDEDEAGQNKCGRRHPGEPKTNGVAEKVVQDVTTQTRKYKVALETRLGKPIHARFIIFKRFVRHVADTIGRCSVGHTEKFLCNDYYTNSFSLVSG